MRKVLLDECLPHKLRLALTAHEVTTVSYAGLDGLTNGTLLRAAEEAGFEVFATVGKGLSHQQNLASRKIAVVALSGQTWDVIGAHVAMISAEIDAARPGR